MSSSSTISKQAVKAFQFEVLGHLESVFKQKTGCPRQSLIVPKARGKLFLKFGNFTSNTQHFVEGLDGFSHIWLFWVFHQNNNLAEESSSDPSVTKFKMMEKAKVRPPRMNGKKIGALSCRSPYRPNPLGMSVVKLDRIERDEFNNAILHLSGIDLVDGTPIIDIKPYIPEYDMVMEKPLSLTLLKDLVRDYVSNEEGKKKRKIDSSSDDIVEQNNSSGSDKNQLTEDLFAKVADWMENMPRKQYEIDNVTFSEKSLEMIEKLVKKSTFYSDPGDVKELIEDLIKLDPRSKYRREKCQDELFGIHVDVFNILCKVTESSAIVEDIEDWSNGSPYTKEELKERTRKHRNETREKNNSPPSSPTSPIGETTTTTESQQQ